MKFKLILLTGFLLPIMVIGQTSAVNLVTIKKLITEKKYDAAVNATTLLLADNEENVELYLLRAQANHQLKKFDAEIADCKNALTLFEGPNTRLSLAKAYLAEKDSVEAQKAIELNIELHPDYVNSYIYLANFARKNNDNKLALEIINDAYDKLRSPILLMARASEYKRLGKYQEALDDYELLITKYNFSFVLFNAAQCASYVGDHKKTLAYYKKFLEKDPNNSAALNNVGYALLRVGSFNSAETYLKKAVEVVPRNIFASSGLASLAYRNGDTEKAFTIADASLLLETKSKVNSLIRGYLNTFEGNFTDAEADFKVALTDPQQAKYALLALAKLFIYKADYAKAIEFASKYLYNRTAQTPEAFNTRGFANYKLGNTAEALKDFASAKALEEDYQPFFNYARADGKEVVKNYTHVQFFLPTSDANECKGGFYTDGKDDFDFKVRVVSAEDVDPKKIRIFESGKVLEQKLATIKSVDKRSFKYMNMTVTDIAIHYTPKSKKSYLKVAYNGSDSQTLVLLK